MSKRRRPQDQDLVSSVRRYLCLATDAGFNLSEVLKRIRGAGFELTSEQPTIQKLKQGERNNLSTDSDLVSIYKFFHDHAAGHQLLGVVVDGQLKNTDPSSGSVPSMNVQQPFCYIGPGGTPTPCCLTGDIRLASIAIEGSQWGAGSVFASVTVACAIWKRVSVERGLIVMKTTPGMITLECDQAWDEPRTLATNIAGVPGQVFITRHDTRFNPSYEIVGLNGSIGKFRTDASFAHLEGLSPGNKVVVTFGTWLGDINNLSSAGDETANDHLSGDDGLTVSDVVEGKYNSVDPRHYKSRLITILKATGLGSGPGGYVELSSCELQIGERA